MKGNNQFLEGMKEALPRVDRGFWQSAARVAVGVTVVAFWIGIPIFGYMGYVLLTEVDAELEAEEEAEEVAECNVYGEKLHGVLDTYPSQEGDTPYVVTASDILVYNIEAAGKDETIKGVLIDIDSSGGTPVAADEIAKALKALAKPSVAVIRGYGDSAAYWAATGADIIFASPLSDVGSIGVTQSYLENAEFNNKEGFIYQQLSIGKYKDMGDPDKPLTTEERQIVMRQLEYYYDYFVNVVATNRDLPVAEVRKLATGESFTGLEAKQNKLIDELGGLPEATPWLEKQIGEKVEICW